VVLIHTVHCQPIYCQPAAFLSVQRMERESSIETVEDLASQQKIKFGTVGGGSTAAFF